MKAFYLLLFAIVMPFAVGCSSNDDNNETPVDPSLFVAKGEDFLSATPNEETSYLVIGSREFIDDGRSWLTEHLEKSYKVKINIPRNKTGVSAMSAGYYADDNFLSTMPFANYFVQNSGIWGMNDDLDDLATIMPQEIKVGTEWTAYNKDSYYSYLDTYICSHKKNVMCKVVDFYSKYTCSNDKKYSNVIKVEVAAIDTMYYKYKDVDQREHFSIECEFYKANVYLAKGIGPVEAQTIDAYTFKKTSVFENVEKLNVKILRK